jgi:hypothetical protein
VYEDIDGIFIPHFGGGPITSNASFAIFYDKCFKLKNVEALKKTLYPFNQNALHYFTISGNVEAINYCFENNIKFLKDTFGLNPFDYARLSKNNSVIGAVYAGINALEQDAKLKVLSQIPLDDILATFNPELIPLLNSAGTHVPSNQ